MSSNIDFDQIIIKFIGENPLTKKEKSMVSDWVDQGCGRPESFLQKRAIVLKLRRRPGIGGKT